MASSSEARDGDFPYDVALSFASEQRNYVERVARALRRKGLRPFYDRYEQAILWGKDLYEHLDEVYRLQARYCILFASKAYAAKAWTTHERRSAQGRALEAHSEYVLPVRFDDTEIPGLRPTIHYMDASTTTPAELAQFFAEKLGPKKRERYLPENPTKLFSALDVTSAKEKEACMTVASSVMDTLERMSTDERALVTHIIREGCPTDVIDEHPHMNLDVLRRDLKISADQALERFRGIASLGFEHQVRDDAEGHPGATVISFEWDDRRLYRDDFIREFAEDRSTEVVEHMIRIASDGHCRECGIDAINRLDFSHLANKKP